MDRDLLTRWTQLQKTRIAHGWPLPLLGALFLALVYLYAPGPNSHSQAASATTTVQAWPIPTPTSFPSQLPYDPPAPPALEFSRSEATFSASRQQQHPRIVKLWGGYDPSMGLDFYTRYDLLISQAFTDRQLNTLRNRNPTMRILYTGTGTYDVDDSPLGSLWLDAQPNTPEYNCFYRGTDGHVLRVPFWGHGMFNMGDEWCRREIVDHTLAQVEGRLPFLYDGLFFDRIHQAITPILAGIDLDHDGRVDDADRVNERYERGVKAFLDSLGQELGQNLIVVANDAPLVYSSRLNGREYETSIRSILDRGSDWAAFRYNYEQWMQASREPRLTIVMGNPPSWMEAKYGRQPWTRMRGAVLQEAASHYQRMRFGLTSALLEGGLYSFEFGTTWHGNAWWYDEYDLAGADRGYLGAPLGEAYLAAGALTSTNMLQNPGFERPQLEPWSLHTRDSEAAIERVRIDAPFSSTYAARITLSTTHDVQDVWLEQAALSITNQERLLLSFWARASTPLWNTHIALHDSQEPNTTVAGPETLALGPTWQHYDVPLSATASLTNAVLALSIGGHTGRVWIDEVSLQRGTSSPVYRRDFSRGIVLCNPAQDTQTVDLGGAYCKIQGPQAPRIKVIVDDSEHSSPSFTKLGGWAGHSQTDEHYDDCWGETYHHALTTQPPDSPSSSATWRPTIPYSDSYTLFAWALPCAQCTHPVTYTIAHASGITAVSVDVQVDEPTWVDLGTYPLNVGSGSSVTLTNQTQAEWVVADALKFESKTRYNDGTCSRSITLDAQDGIILLRGPHRAFLPLLHRH